MRWPRAEAQAVELGCVGGRWPATLSSCRGREADEGRAWLPQAGLGRRRLGGPRPARPGPSQTRLGSIRAACEHVLYCVPGDLALWPVAIPLLPEMQITGRTTRLAHNFEKGIDVIS